MSFKRCVMGAAGAALALGLSSQSQAIMLTQISTNFNTPIGIDYHEPTNSVVMSVNYSGGQPHNFERVQLDGTHVQFSNIAGLTDEIKIATARSGNAGGWAPGTLFTGNGVDGQILQIAPNGSSSSLLVDLPGAGNGLMRGSLYVDRTGVYGGDLIAVTTGGEVWRVNSGGVPTMLADVNTHLEGMITVPNNVAQYGPLAGKIIAGAENQSLLYVFDQNGLVGTHAVGVNIEDIDLINANENFFGVNFGTGRLLGAPASDFTSMVGDILLTQEFGGAPSGLFALSWDNINNQLVTTPVTLDAGSAIPGQWEHVTFAPAGIVEIIPTNPLGGIPEPVTATLGLMGMGVLGASVRRRTA